MIYLVAASLLLGTALIALLVAAADNTAFFAGHLPTLLVATAAAIVGLVTLIAYQAFVLVRRIRAGVFGAKLTARFFLVISLMALLPGSVVYAVSVQFLVRSIESWFDVRMETALEGGLTLGRSALEHVQREMVTKSEHMARQLGDIPLVLQVARLDDLREASGLLEVGLLDEQGRLLGFSSGRSDALLPPPVEQGALWQARLLQPWSRLTANAQGGIDVHVVAPVPLLALRERLRILQVTQPVPGPLARDAQQVEEAHQGYQELLLSRLGLKRLYGISLTMALTLALFSALSLAFLLSERLAAPLRALARGTRAVARGDFTLVPDTARRDELGMLTQSFNRMTRQLAEARATAEESHDKLLEANAYLEGVLSSVTAGVVTLEPNLDVRLANPAAAAILGVERADLEGRPLAAWGLADAGADAAPEPEGLGHFAAEMARHFRASPTQAWREQVDLVTPRGKRSLLVRGTPLSPDERPDYVLVLDDVTQLIRAQRDAAWGEAARRMAHEIKNPLTPIQLSAERLEAKLADRLEGAARDTLTRATATIVGQVAALKGLVDAFAQYARLPSPRIERVDLNTLTREVLHLYEGDLPIETHLAERLPPVAGDASLLRQVLVNLLKNAQEALHEHPAPHIRVQTLLEGERIALTVEDNGPGFPEELRERMFEPYATTKPRGTGLGLPVVKKIVEEHHGEIEVVNLEGGGARICVRLPILDDEKG
ncbi:MAG: multi-sensor signal transduction histidine kinase [bacterium]|nr:MAG: multi-sensor signal transduction histidine kinase [bacterium]KAF0147995.1 MAG: multi-sensor signal transduction histidine kinase [bacterium]KAF0167533.1 MAG: multi-sensor signal transduction histidine kinase [bacterium]TXT20545.1 MAG: multi-sensor signal transduction histidine kinase [bacterium]